MTEDEILELGQFSEELLRHPHFETILNHFRQHCFAHFVSTKPHEVKARESIFAQFQGAQDLLSHIVMIVHERHKILERNAPSSPDAQEID